MAYLDFTAGYSRCYNSCHEKSNFRRAARARPGREVLGIESAAVQALVQRIDGTFLRALDIILSCDGRVIVSGMGKSGHIARKIASTFSSTGTPAYFVHPAEASHGDLGMITSEDVLSRCRIPVKVKNCLPLFQSSTPGGKADLPDRQPAIYSGSGGGCAPQCSGG